MTHVLVIGAGVSGLIAALRLAESGCRVTMLEASDRVGGRIRTAHVGEAAVELGAEFVHGKPPELLALLEDLGLQRYDIAGTDISFAPDGTLHSHTVAEDDDTGEADPGDPFSLLSRVVEWAAAHPTDDLTFADFVRLHAPHASDVGSATGYVEGFNAADASEISVQSLAVQQRAEDSIEGGTNSHVRGGYGQLPQRLADRLKSAGGTVHLQRTVTEVRWGAAPGGPPMLCVCSNGDTFAADAAVVTLPLGVLQSGSVRFQPEPTDTLHQAGRMRMGQVCRINLVFRRRWWAEIDHPAHDALETLGFLLPEQRLPGRHFNVFWTGFPGTDPVLTAWVGGPSAAAFDHLDDHAVAHIACRDLAQIFGLSYEAVLDELTSHHLHNWQRDPLALGAYSWVPVGAVDASARMAEPVGGALFFAGEHTDTTGHWGTVHGALRSGLRAARQVLAASCPDGEAPA